MNCFFLLLSLESNLLFGDEAIILIVDVLILRLFIADIISQRNVAKCLKTLNTHKDELILVFILHIAIGPQYDHRQCRDVGEAEHCELYDELFDPVPR